MNVKHEWATVAPGLEMSRDALMVDGVRVNLTPVQAREWATKLGGRLPTPAELDQRWRAAQIKNSPHTYPGDLPKYGPDHSRAIDLDVAMSGGGIVGNVGKHWVDYPLPGNRRALYGWHVDTPMNNWRGIPLHPSETLPGTKVIQRPWDSNHNDAHTGYSMTGVFTRVIPKPNHDTDPAMPITDPLSPEPTKLGDSGPDVRVWQRWLNINGYGTLVVDGKHGPKTEAATRKWRADKPTPVNGIIRTYPLIRAKNFTWGDRKPGDVHFITLHSIQCPVRPGFARSNARAFAAPSARNASIHYWVGPDETVQGLETRHLAWGAKSGPERHAQLHAIHIEHTGYTADPSRGQVQTDWLGEGWPVLVASARLCADLIAEWDLLPEQCTHERMAEWRDAMRKSDRKTAWSLRCINMHHHWTRAYNVVGGNQDIGGWPWPEWLTELRGWL